MFVIKIEKTEIVGWEHAIRGMRNPMNSWDKSDSTFDEDGGTFVGEKDGELMRKLARNGSVHAKYRRMIAVYVDILAPLYWWKEFDTYKVGTVANSCSTMHKIHEKPFTLDDFSCEHLENITSSMDFLTSFEMLVDDLNTARNWYIKTKDERFWWQMIQLLPSSYNQKRTVMLNYEVLANIYRSRKDHKLDEWRDFCRWIEDLPLSEIITLRGDTNDNQ